MATQDKQHFVLNRHFELHGNNVMGPARFLKADLVKSELSENEFSELLEKGIFVRETEFSEEEPLIPEQRSVYEIIDIIINDGKVFVDIAQLEGIATEDHCSAVEWVVKTINQSGIL